MVFVCFPAKAVFRHAETIPVSISPSCPASLSLGSSVYIVFSPNPCNIITVNPLTISHPVACKHVHAYSALPLLLPLPFFLCHTLINSDPPPLPQQISLSHHWPPITRSHSFETIARETTKTLEVSNPTYYSAWGGQDCKNPTGRKLWTRLRGWQSVQCRRKKTVALNVPKL